MSDDADADPDLPTVLDLLEDDGTRTILEATATEVRSSSELAEMVDVSRQTVYRRLDELQAAGLVRERTRPRPDGHHESVYEATLAEVHVELTGEGFEFDLEVETEDERRDPADELTKLWGEF